MLSDIYHINTDYCAFGFECTKPTSNLIIFVRLDNIYRLYSILYSILPVGCKRKFQKQNHHLRTFLSCMTGNQPSGEMTDGAIALQWLGLRSTEKDESCRYRNPMIWLVRSGHSKITSWGWFVLQIQACCVVDVFRRRADALSLSNPTQTHKAIDSRRSSGICRCKEATLH